MSKGLGRIEREILAITQRQPQAVYSALSLATAIHRIEPPEFRLPPELAVPAAIAARIEAVALQVRVEQAERMVSPAQHSAARRALASLKAQGVRHQQPDPEPPPQQPAVEAGQPPAGGPTGA